MNVREDKALFVCPRSLNLESLYREDMAFNLVSFGFSFLRCAVSFFLVSFSFCLPCHKKLSWQLKYLPSKFCIFMVN